MKEREVNQIKWPVGYSAQGDWVRREKMRKQAESKKEL